MTTDTEKKLQSREQARAAIEKEFGKGSIFKFSEKPAMQVEALHSGSLGIDLSLGIGGYPRGRIIEIYGAEASGKTTLTLHAIAEAQKAGGSAAFIDAEHALDPVYAGNLGVNMDDLYISQPDTGEQALEIAETLVRSGGFDLVVVDSVAALVPKAEIDGEMGDSHVGLQARLMSQAMRKLSGVVSSTKTTMIFINQTRTKIGVMYGDPTTTSGGQALKFYASVRLEVKRIGVIKDGDNVTGGKTRVKVVKNKVAPPFKETEFDIVFGKGVNAIGEIVDEAVNLKIIDKSGAWYSYENERLGQGRDNVVSHLSDNEELLGKIKSQVYQALGLPL